MSIDVSALRQQFHFFRSHPRGMYFDSASTTQKPDCTIRAMDACWQCAANVGRSSHSMAAMLTQSIDDVRRLTGDFLGAHSCNEIVFTSGATHSLNTVALAWGLHHLRSGDEILYCPDDHKSCVLPWVHLQETLRRFGVDIRLVAFRNTFAGDADIDDLVSRVTPRTRLIALTHIHNAFGAKTDVERVRPLIGDDIVISLDAAQSVGHIPVDVRRLGVDFLSFSGHKMFAATGVGVLWAHERLHSALHPVLIGGGDATIAGMQHDRLPPMPGLLEAGTPNIAGILSLGAAIRFVDSLGMDQVHARLHALTRHLLLQLRRLPGVTFVGGPGCCTCDVGYGIVSFRIASLSAQDVGFILDQHRMYVRTGMHCRANDAIVDDSIRVSLQVYNTEEEIDALVAVLRDAVAAA